MSRDRTGSGSTHLVFSGFPWFFSGSVFSGFLDQKKPENQVFEKPDPEAGLLDLVFSDFFIKRNQQNF